MAPLNIAIVGCTGAVGLEVLHLLEKEVHNEKFPVKNVYLFASKRSAGKKIPSQVFGELEIQEFSVENVHAVPDLHYVFLAVSGSFALQYAKELTKPGAKYPIVIDNSSAFRYDDDIPLVIPEINGDAIQGSTLIANPNCTTAVAAMSLWPIHCKYKIKKLIMSTYQAASGAGQEGMNELREGTAQALKDETPEHKIFAHPLPFNVVPHIDAFQTNGYTKEEMKVTWETQKIFRDSSIAVSCTAVRIPTMRAHAEAITLETAEKIDPSDVRTLLQEAEGVEVVDEPAENKYPMPLNASTKADVEVGRLRQNLVFGEHGLDLFVCGDQLLRGAALNAVLIAKYLEDPRPSKFSPQSN